MNAFLQWCVIINWAFITPVWAGAAELLDDVQLTQALKGGQLCCVIDARNESRRKQQPIPFALAHQEGMTLSGSGFAVVVADYDQKALKVAQTLAQQKPCPAGRPERLCREGRLRGLETDACGRGQFIRAAGCGAAKQLHHPQQHLRAGKIVAGVQIGHADPA